MPFLSDLSVGGDSCFIRSFNLAWNHSVIEGIKLVRICADAFRKVKVAWHQIQLIGSLGGKNHLLWISKILRMWISSKNNWFDNLSLKMRGSGTGCAAAHPLFAAFFDKDHSFSKISMSITSLRTHILEASAAPEWWVCLNLCQQGPAFDRVSN